MEGNKFDPMTGEPIVRDAAADAVNEASSATEQVKSSFDYDPTAGTSAYGDGVTSAPEKKKGAGKLIAIIAAAVALVAAIVCLVIFVILPNFGKPMTKIEKALVNTFSKLDKGDNLLLTALSPKGLQKTDTFTLAVEGDIEDLGSANFDMIKTKDALQLNVGADLSEMLDIPYIDAQFLYDKESISIASSLLNNQYIYYYTEDVDDDSFLGEAFEELEEQGLDAETVNKMLKDYYDTLMDFESLNKTNEELLEECKDHLRDLDVKKAESAEFEIDGKDVKCKGYTVTITEKDVKKLLDSYTKSMKSTFEKSMGSMLEAADTDIDELMDDAFGEAYESIEDMEDVEIDFYIYKNEIAAIEMEVDDSKLSIQFQGGDYRAQNILLDADGSKVELTGEKKGNVEKATLKADKETLFSYEFDSKKGDLTLTVSDGYDDYEIEGINIKSKDDELVVSFEDIDLEGVAFNGSITLKKDAKIKSMSGDEFSLNEATEDDLMETLEDESEALEELSGLSSIFGGGYDYDDYDYDDYDWDEEDWDDEDWDEEDWDEEDWDDEEEDW